MFPAPRAIPRSEPSHEDPSVVIAASPSLSIVPAGKPAADAHPVIGEISVVTH